MNFDFMMECEIKDPKSRRHTMRSTKNLWMQKHIIGRSRSRAESCSGKQQSGSAVFTMIITRLVSRKVHC